MTLKDVVGLGAVYASLGVSAIAGLAVRFMNPELTETQLLIEYSWLWAILVGMMAIAAVTYFAIES